MGVIDYQSCLKKMQTFTNERNAETTDECWVCEHPPVFTLGQAGLSEHILTRSEIPIVKSDRGGQVTYHGPNQLMLYTLIDLKRKSIGVKALVSQLEQLIIDLLASFDIKAQRREGAPGVYVDQAKISALGLRVRKGASYHGLALNLSMDLSPFKQINPCGYAGMAVVNLADLVPFPVDRQVIEQKLLLLLQQSFDYQELVFKYDSID